ncbi:MAG: tRNA uracil 4-sulfurtransferase ThiI [Chitinophagales bacterium]
MFDSILIRYGEIGLKGDNRGFFEQTLVQNIQFDLKGLDYNITRSSGRIMVRTDGDNDEIIERLRKVFGIVSVSPVKTTGLNLDAIINACSEVIEVNDVKTGTFKVETRRANKNFPMTSPEVSSQVGGALLARHGYLKVDVHDPDVTVSIEIRNKEASIYSSYIPGPGGLPVGVSGKGLLLLSGGIDSPVAGWMSMKRGIKISAIHFHSFPFTSERAKLKVIKLAEKLADYNQTLKLFLVNITEIQETILRQCPEKYRVTILRRMMLRIAERIAESNGVQALITGESLGQVASQTIESMSVIGKACNLLILKPLTGMDKVEIIKIAKAIETYETSIMPYEDCCSLFLPKHPVTRPTLQRVLEAEKAAAWDDPLRDAIANVEIVDFE